MWILLTMLAGVLLGLRWFPIRFAKLNSVLQIVCTCVLIFTMGVLLGSRPDFFSELSRFGVYSLVLAIVPIGLSVGAVYLLTRRWSTDD